MPTVDYSQETWIQVPVSSPLTGKSVYLSFPFCERRSVEVGGFANLKSNLYPETSVLACNPV